jgi:hypothetical protein
MIVNLVDKQLLEGLMETSITGLELKLKAMSKTIRAQFKQLQAKMILN